MGDEEPGERPGHGLATLAKDGLRIISENKTLTVLLYFGWIFVKVLAAAHGILATALGILSASPLPVIVAGATLSTLPLIAVDVLAAIVCLAAAGHWRGRWLPAADRERRGTHRVAALVQRNTGLVCAVIVLALAVGILASAVLTVVELGFALLVGLVVRVVTRRSQRTCIAPRRPGPATWHQVVARMRADRCASGLGVMFAVLIIALNVAQVAKTVWEPHQALYRPDGTVLDVGYVLDESNGRIVLLRSHSRDLHIYRDAEVGRRKVCRTGDKLYGVSYVTDSLWEMTFNRSHLPDCP